MVVIRTALQAINNIAESLKRKYSHAGEKAMIDIGNVNVATSFGLQVGQCKQTGSRFKESMVQSIGIYRAVLKDCGPF